MEKVKVYSLVAMRAEGCQCRVKGGIIKIVEGIVEETENTLCLELPTNVYLNGKFLKKISKKLIMSKKEFKEIPEKGEILWIIYTGDFTTTTRTMKIIKVSPSLREQWIKRYKQPPILNLILETSLDPNKIPSLIESIINAEIISVPTRRE
jgi:hypothetical protein